MHFPCPSHRAELGRPQQPSPAAPLADPALPQPSLGQSHLIQPKSHLSFAPFGAGGLFFLSFFVLIFSFVLLLFALRRPKGCSTRPIETWTAGGARATSQRRSWRKESLSARTTRDSWRRCELAYMRVLASYVACFACGREGMSALIC